METADEGVRTRSRIGGVLLIAGSLLFWGSWALMPLPGTADPVFILQAVSRARPEVWLSVVLQLASAAAWAVALVLVPAPVGARGARAWWIGACLLAVGATASAADAIYHLAAYELAHPDVATELAGPVMTRLQGPDLALILPGIGAFFAGAIALSVGAVRADIAPRASLAVLALAVPAGASRALFPAGVAPRIAGLIVLACFVAPLAWIGWRVARR